MEKKLYNLTINETLEKVMPPLQDDEIERLTKKLLEEGCRDDLVVWNGVIVDGHNRYRICHEYGIPFSYVERSFESEEAAKLWIIDTQLGRRNLSDFLRCEMALQYEEQLKAEAKKRMLAGKRIEAEDPVSNLTQGSGKTRDALAKVARVSAGKFHMAKKLMDEADEATKERLRKGKVSIFGAYSALPGKQPTEKREKPDDETESTISSGSQPKAPAIKVTEPLPSTPSEVKQPPKSPKATQPFLTPARVQDPKSRRNPYEIMPGFDSTQTLGSLAEHKYECPSESVYETEPVKVFGGMPSDDQAMRSNAEMIQARWEVKECSENYVQMLRDVLRKMSSASKNEENLQELRALVMECCEQAVSVLTV